MKSLAGERIETIALTNGGIGGDRVVHVQDADGRIVTARTSPALLGLRGALGPDGEPLIEGRRWTAPEAVAAVAAAAGAVPDSYATTAPSASTSFPCS